MREINDRTNRLPSASVPALAAHRSAGRAGRQCSRRSGLADSYASMPSAIGPMWVAWGVDGITAVVPADDETSFVASYGRPLRRAASVPAALLRTPAFDLRGLTEFERSVLDATRHIPAGEV